VPLWVCRPTAAEVLTHPLMWGAETRLAFLRTRATEWRGRTGWRGARPCWRTWRGRRRGRWGPGQWKDRIDGALLGNLGMYRRYNFRSVRDLLRVIRNKCNHYRELPEDVQVGSFVAGPCVLAAKYSTVQFFKP